MARKNAENKQHADKQQHAEKQQGEQKVHGDALDAAVSSAGEHNSTTQHQSSIPAPDDGGHARSQAAHLGGHAHDHTKPVGDMRKYEAEREPPKDVSRAGKEYRRQ